MKIRTTICGYVAWVNTETNKIDMVNSDPSARNYLKLNGCKFEGFGYTAPSEFIEKILK